jgi:hypothetical protein
MPAIAVNHQAAGSWPIYEELAPLAFMKTGPKA